MCPRAEQAEPERCFSGMGEEKPGFLRGGAPLGEGVTSDTAIAWPQSEHSGTAM